MFDCRVTLFLSISYALCFGQQYSEYVKYQWDYLNYIWPSSEAYKRALEDKSYIPENNPLVGIKVWKDRLYLTVPRWKNGVPATLVSTSLYPVNDDKSPLLEPFPNWEMQKLDDCSAFQFVQSMEIDTLGRMWIIDNGRTETLMPSSRTKCPPRLVILDLEDNNKVLIDYKFPNDVVHSESVYLNDIVLDHEDGGYAYITDMDDKFPGIVVFSLKQKNSWKISHESMKSVKSASLVVNGTTLTLQEAAVDGIALSPASTEGYRVVYYTPLSSHYLYSVSANELKNNKLQDVKIVSKKTSQTDGMFMNSAGYLYYGLLGEDTVGIWNTDLPFEEHIHFQDRAVNQWPDSFGMDTEGYLYWTTNRLQKFMSNNVNIDEANYRVIASKSYVRSYMYYQNKTAPDFPSIN